MKDIISAQNQAYKDIKALAHSAKARRQQMASFVEGVHLVQSFLAAGIAPQQCIVSRTALQNAEVDPLVQQCEALQAEVILVSDNLFAGISTVETAVGIAIVIPTPTPAQPGAITQNTLVLDDVQDPGNVGTMLRTAAAAGVTAVYCSPATASLWSPKVLRAGMGAHVALQLYEQCDIRQLIQQSALPVLATSLGTSASLYATDVSAGAVWVFGNEGQGVAADILALPQVTSVFIPQTSAVESLNVAAAAAVCLFEQRRQQLAAQ